MTAASGAAPGGGLTIERVGLRLRDGSLTAAALAAELLDGLATVGVSLGAVAALHREQALRAATDADRELAAGRDRGPLHGIPLVVKDVIGTRDGPTRAGSRVPPPGFPQGVDALAVRRLREAGAVILGKASTLEYAIGEPDPETGVPVPRNPWDPRRSPSGSSAGTAIAIAAGLALGGLGTDTGGSARSPAAATGHTALKVTRGRVPTSGVVPVAASLDTVCPMARSARDCAFLLRAIAGADPSDPRSASVDVPDYAAGLGGDLRGVRIGLPRTYFFDAAGLDPEVGAAVQTAAEVLAGLGAELVDVEVPFAEAAKHANLLIVRAEAFAYHRVGLRERWSSYGRYTRRTILPGALIEPADAAALQRFRRAFRRALDGVFAEVDLLLTPTTARVAAPLGASAAAGTAGRFAMPDFQAQWNLAGVPAIALPVGFNVEGLPMSMQLIGRAFEEGLVLRAADAYQSITDWHLAVAPATPV